MTVHVHVQALMFYALAKMHKGAVIQDNMGRCRHLYLCVRARVCTCVCMRASVCERVCECACAHTGIYVRS